MAFGKKPANGREGTGIYTLQGSVVFCARCGHGCRLNSSDLTGGPFRCRKCTQVFCGRCFSDFNGLCLNDVGAATVDAQEFVREHGLTDQLFTDTEPNIVIEIGNQIAHYDGQSRKVFSGNGWKFEEHWLCVTDGGVVKDKVDSTEVQKIYTTSPNGDLVKAIKEWNRKYRVKVLAGGEAHAGSGKKAKG